MKIGFTCSHPILHAGLNQMLREAKEQCDYPQFVDYRLIPSLDRKEKNLLHKHLLKDTVC